MSTANGAAGTHAALRSHGFALCKPDPGEKKPTYKGWSTRSLEPGDFEPGALIGILGGPLSDGGRPGHALIIIDLDAMEAVEKADAFLPPTAMEEGREGKARDHRYFLVPVDTIPPSMHSPAEQGASAATALTGHPGPAKRAFNHAETKERVIDFLGTGGQVVCPSPGGRREWVGGEPGEPAVVPFPLLWDATCRLAFACGCKMPHANGAAPPSGGRTLNLHDDVERRAVAYLAKCDPAVSGQNGHGDTYWPARVVCWGFDLGAEVGFRLLSDHFNPRCVPPWTEAELRHKCRDADTLDFGKPRGWLLNDEAPPRAAPRASAPRLSPKTFAVGGLDLQPGTSRQTAGGTVKVPLNVLRNGVRVDALVLSTTPTGRKQAQAHIAQLAAQDWLRNGVPEGALGGGPGARQAQA